MNKTIFSLAFLMAIMAFDQPVIQKTTDIQEPPDVLEVPVDRCSIENSTFIDGEEIVYRIYYNWNFVWLNAGEVTFKVTETEKEYHLSVVGTTYESYEWFYKVRDRYDTYIDKKTLLPNVSVRNIQEGKYRLYDEVTFLKDRKLATSLRGKSKETAEVSEYAVEDCMHDILSIIYYTRNVDFSNLDSGAEIPIKIFMDKEVWPLHVLYKGKEERKKIKGKGKFKTIKFSPEVIAGDVFNNGAEMDVWITDDKNKIPLLIESPVSVGSVKAVLKEYKGLRYDMTAKVKK